MMSFTVRDLMITPVVTVRRDTPFKVIAARMLAVGVAAVPVIDDSGLVLGVVAAHDLLARKASRGTRGLGLAASLRHRGEQDEATGTAAGRLMTSPAATIRAGATTQEAAGLMCRYRVTSLPVTDSRGRLIGMISQDDILGTFTRSDQAIWHEVTNRVISQEFALNPQEFTVTVRQGIVTLVGCPENDQAGRSLADAVRHVEGVIAVRDRLSCQAHRHDRGVVGQQNSFWIREVPP